MLFQPSGWRFSFPEMQFSNFLQQNVLYKWRNKQMKNQPAVPDIVEPWCFFVAMGYKGNRSTLDIFTYRQ